MTSSTEATTMGTSVTSIRHLLVNANPSPDSFDHAIVATYAAEATRCGHDTVVRDLYAMGFDPVLKAEEKPLQSASVRAPDVDYELKMVGAADIIVLIYPIWFGLPPAMLKGYIDRVLGAGYSFRNVHDRTGQPELQGKPLLSFSTSGTSQSWLDEQGQVTSLRQIWDVYLWQGFGMKQSDHILIDSIVPNINETYAAQQLERVRATAERTCAMLASNRHAL